MPVLVNQREHTAIHEILTQHIDRTRKLLTDSLIELILEKDYETVTVQDIIDRAGKFPGISSGRDHK